MKYFFFSFTGLAYPVAYQLQNEGHEVIEAQQQGHQHPFGAAERPRDFGLINAGAGRKQGHETCGRFGFGMGGVNFNHGGLSRCEQLL